MKRNLAAVSPIPLLHEYYLGRLAAGTATPNDIYKWIETKTITP
jgi:hypothetical protein